LQQFEQAALFGSGTVIELSGINLRGQVDQDAPFVLKGCYEFVFAKKP